MNDYESIDNEKLTIITDDCRNDGCELGSKAKVSIEAINAALDKAYGKMDHVRKNGIIEEINELDKKIAEKRKYLKDVETKQNQYEKAKNARDAHLDNTINADSLQPGEQALYSIVFIIMFIAVVVYYGSAVLTAFVLPPQISLEPTIINAKAIYLCSKDVSQRIWLAIAIGLPVAMVFFGYLVNKKEKIKLASVGNLEQQIWMLSVLKMIPSRVWIFAGLMLVDFFLAYSILAQNIKIRITMGTLPSGASPDILSPIFWLVVIFGVAFYMGTSTSLIKLLRPQQGMDTSEDAVQMADINSNLSQLDVERNNHIEEIDKLEGDKKQLLKLQRNGLHSSSDAKYKLRFFDAFIAGVKEGYQQRCESNVQRERERIESRHKTELQDIEKDSAQVRNTFDPGLNP